MMNHMMLLLAVLVLGTLSASHLKTNHKAKKHHKQFFLGKSGYIASDESGKHSPVDHEPWHYKIMSPEVMFASKEINKADPLSYNQQEDTEHKAGCPKEEQFPLEEQEAPPKQRIYAKSPDPYYDPTDQLRIESYHKDVLAVPVVMERDLVTDQQALENQRKQLYSNNRYYYDPSVLDHVYEIDGPKNIMHTLVQPIEGTIHTQRKTIPYDELFQRNFVDDIVKHQYKMPHKQDVPIKQIQAVYQRIRQQKNKLVADKLKDEVMPALNKNQKKK